ncbi:MAG TPA: DHA2 family efflux MFS transporter permease subunit [Propionibacteriaceae bacterium]|nr:DHA2 family efflux MFS transporter permease subunit [Propionibacteriaceae bacterium]
MTTAPATAAPPISATGKHTAVIATLLVAAFVMILNETIMGVALPRLMRSLDINAATGQWLTTAFLLTMAVVIPTTGFLLQRLSTRAVFLGAMTLFCAGTLLAGVSPGFWLLLTARVVQASGTAIMLPLLMTTILTLVPLEHRGRVMGNVSIVISVAPAIGPTLSGLILHYLSWRFMFLLVLPVALAALAYGALRLANVGEVGTKSLDVTSVLLSVPAFGGLVFGLSRIGESSGGQLVVPVAALVLSVICLGLFGWRQITLQARGNPLLDLRVFGYPMFRVGTALLVITMMGLFSVVVLLPLYLQNIHGLGSLATGLLLLPGGLLMGLLAPGVGRLFDRYGPRGLTTLGATLVTVALWRFSAATPQTPIWLLLAIHVLLSLGLACLFTPGFTTALNPLPPSLYSHGSATLTTLQQVAGAAGTALLVTVFTAHALRLSAQGAPQAAAQAAGLQTAFLLAAGIASIGIVLALFLRSPREGEQGAPSER